MACSSQYVISTLFYKLFTFTNLDTPFATGRLYQIIKSMKIAVSFIIFIFDKKYVWYYRVMVNVRFVPPRINVLLFTCEECAQPSNTALVFLRTTAHHAVL